MNRSIKVDRTELRGINQGMIQEGERKQQILHVTKGGMVSKA